MNLPVRPMAPQSDDCVGPLSNDRMCWHLCHTITSSGTSIVRSHPLAPLSYDHILWHLYRTITSSGTSIVRSRPVLRLSDHNLPHGHLRQTVTSIRRSPPSNDHLRQTFTPVKRSPPSDDHLRKTITSLRRLRPLGRRCTPYTCSRVCTEQRGEGTETRPAERRRNTRICRQPAKRSAKSQLKN